MTAILEINDSDLSLYQGTELLYRAPAIAVARRGEMLFGEPAQRVARMHPQQTNAHYFGRLNADPLPQPVPGAANHADLVYLHLRELHELVTDDLILAVPGIFSADQLGVLLGICQEAGLRICGFVDSAVAAASTRATAASACYLDVHLQRISVTLLEVNSEVARTAAEEIGECGLVQLVDGWVNVIADRFVRDTRFDPLHTAVTEQQLYNQVYDWIDDDHAQNRAEMGVEIEYHDQVRRAEIARTLLEDKAQQRLEPLVVRLKERLTGNSELLLSARAARLPGMGVLLSRHGFKWTALGTHAVAEGCVNNLGLIRAIDGNLRLITRLPQLHEPTSTVVPVTHPTHVLQGHMARPLAANGLGLPVESRQDGLWLVAGTGVLLNGERPAGDAQLRVGDSLQIGDEMFRLIHVAG